GDGVGHRGLETLARRRIVVDHVRVIGRLAGGDGERAGGEVALVGGGLIRVRRAGGTRGAAGEQQGGGGGRDGQDGAQGTRHGRTSGDGVRGTAVLSADAAASVSRMP